MGCLRARLRRGAACLKPQPFKARMPLNRGQRRCGRCTTGMRTCSVNGQDRPEAKALIELARSLTLSRPDMNETASEVEAMVDAALGRGPAIEVELGFEAAARRLRAGWLRSVAAETSRVLRSPTESEIERLERGRHDAYGYERDFQPQSLEARCESFFGEPPAGWTAGHLLFSSGQAALSTILLHLAEHRPDKIRVSHVGSYFETADLVERACVRTDRSADADCIIVEPIACDGRFAAHDPGVIARSLNPGQTLIVDETLSAPRTRLPAMLGGALAPGAAIVRLVSGLKLLQQGLELANVGVVSVFASRPDRTQCLVEGLKRCRTLAGAGLRFVDALALEAPFFLDAGATQAYADGVFAHNEALRRAVSARNRLFRPLGEATLADAAAPYCAFQLANGNSAPALEALAQHIEREARARGLLIQRGGSFGFRGHRYEVIEPETGEEPFLRIALGARGDRSCQGLVALVAELAAGRASAAA